MAIIVINKILLTSVDPMRVLALSISPVSGSTKYMFLSSQPQIRYLMPFGAVHGITALTN